MAAGAGKNCLMSESQAELEVLRDTWPPSPWQILIGIVLALAALFFLTHSVALPGNGLARVFEFEQVKWLSIGLAALLWAGLLLVGRIEKMPTINIGPMDVAATAFLAFFVLSSLWSPDAQAAWTSVAYGLGAYAVYVLARTTDTTAMRSVIWVFALAAQVFALFLAAFTDDTLVASGLGNENFAVTFIGVVGAMSLTVNRFGPLRIRIVTLSITALSMVYLLFVADTNMQYLALGFGAVFFVVLSRPRLAAPAAIGLLLVFVVAVGALLSTDRAIPANARERLEIWGNTAAMIADAPWIGTGAGGYFYTLGDYHGRYHDLLPQWERPRLSNLVRQTDSAENELLHIAAETGVVGVFLALVLVSLLFRASLREPSSQTARYSIPIVVLLGYSTVSFPLQNASTLLLGAILVGALASAAQRRDGLFALRSRRCLLPVIAMLGLAAQLWVAIPQTRASYTFSKANLLDVSGDKSGAATMILKALRVSDSSPRLRLRAYTQVMVAGPEYWRESSLGPNELDSLYRLSSSASPSNPLLIDLRLKQLLSSTGRQLDRREIEELIANLKRSTGPDDANGHILEAAFSIQIGETQRARKALAAARSLVRDPPDENDITNKRNIEVLEGQLEARNGR
jgi:O-antigen ligase